MSTRRVVMRNVRVYTGARTTTSGRTGQAVPTAMCIDGPSIDWLGPDADAERFLDGADEVIDLDGYLVTPAFVDSHVHLSQTGHLLHGIDLSTARGAADVSASVERYANAHPGSVILGSGWDETRWDDQTLPTAAELDRAAPGRAVCLSRVDGHSAIISGAVVAAAPGLTERPGWSDTGRVEREAQHLARERVQALITPGQQETALRTALAAAAAAGIGCVHEMSAPHINPADDIPALRRIAAESPTIQVVPYWGELDDGDQRGGVARARQLGCAGAGGDLCVDGALGSRTAALRADYCDAPGHRGHRYLDPEQVHAHVVACTRASLQAGFHCIGDDALDSVVAGFAAAAKELGTPELARMRHRLEHAELVAPELIAEISRLGLVVSAQPAFDAAWGGAAAMYAARLGPDRARLANPFAAFARAGVRLAFGSDSPVTPFAPWEGVRAAVHPAVDQHALDLAPAFAAHTTGGWAAAAGGAKDHRVAAGELRVGAKATFAVWDLTADTPRESASDPPLPALGADDRPPVCVRTVVAGRTIYARAE